MVDIGDVYVGYWTLVVQIVDIGDRDGEHWWFDGWILVMEMV